MRDAEVAQVRDELARGVEVEVARELQAVGGAQLGHPACLSTTTDRAITFTLPRAGTLHAPGSASGSAVESSRPQLAP